jgi:hypothetical protein
MPYHPPRTLTRTQTDLMREADPEWRPAMSGRETYYEFSNGRKFEDTPAKRFPYDRA